MNPGALNISAYPQSEYSMQKERTGREASVTMASRWMRHDALQRTLPNCQPYSVLSHSARDRPNPLRQTFPAATPRTSDEFTAVTARWHRSVGKTSRSNLPPDKTMRTGGYNPHSPCEFSRYFRPVHTLGH
jgi:hypothetical protein